LGIDIGFHGRARDENVKYMPELEPEALGSALLRWRERSRTPTDSVNRGSNTGDNSANDYDGRQLDLNEAAMDGDGRADTDEESTSKYRNTSTPAIDGKQQVGIARDIDGKHTTERSSPVNGFGAGTVVVSFRKKSKASQA
jgi:hypothetical protein